MKFVVAIILLVLAGGVGYWRFFEKDISSDSAVAVTCVEVRKGPFMVGVSATGRLLSRKTDAVKSLYTGIIRDNGFENGDYVAKGISLAVVTPPEEIRKKKQTDLELAELDLALVSEQRLQAEELLKAKAASEREVNELRIRERRQQTVVENLREELSAKPVPAPFSGLLAEKRFHSGDRINMGTELFTLIDTHAVMVEAKVHQYDLPKIHPGQKATLRSEIFCQPHQGKITEISTVTARQNTSGFGEGYSSSFNVYIQVDDLASEELRIGAAVEVEMVLEEKQNVISIPLECVRIEGMATGDSPRSFTYNPFLPYRMARRQPEQPLTDGQNEKEEIRRSLFVNENGIARKRPITTGAANENIVEVLSGLKEGELVVAIGNAEIVEGMKLTIP